MGIEVVIPLEKNGIKALVMVSANFNYVNFKNVFIRDDHRPMQLHHKCIIDEQNLGKIFFDVWTKDRTKAYSRLTCLYFM